MLSTFIEEYKTEKQHFEGVARRCWTHLLTLKEEQRDNVCRDIELFLGERVGQAEARVTSEGKAAKSTSASEAFLSVYCAALYAIHSQLAAPLAWRSAAESHVADHRPSTPSASAASALVRFCEGYLLRSPAATSKLFQALLDFTGMGVPLLSLVLHAYGSAVVDVVARTPSEESAAAVDLCLSHLHVAVEACTHEEACAHQLTIAHPVFLHVARVSGRLDAGFHFFQQPVRVVSPMETGVSLSDYVTYYAEAALLLASVRQYAAAFYALTPVHSLPPTWGLSERLASRSLKDVAISDDTSAGGATATGDAAGSGSHPSSQQPGIYSASSYPWYRRSPVSTTHTTQVSNYRGERNSDEKIEWRLLLAPDAPEVVRDRQVRSWAVRLSMMLLTLAFGGGNPRAVEKLGKSSASPLDDGEADWKGTNSAALSSHVCFPHPIFYHLSQSTRVSLEGVLASAGAFSSAETPAYVALLRAVAQRDAAGARAVLVKFSATAFAADMTQRLAEVAVTEYLQRHVVMDVARMYACVPLHMLVTRTAQGVGSDDAAQQAHAVLKTLAQLCASGELASCQVCTKSEAESKSGEAGVDVARVVASEELEHAAVRGDLKATSVHLTMPSVSGYLQLCAAVVSPQLVTGDVSCEGVKAPGATNASLLQMLAQLKTLQQSVDNELSSIRAIR